MTILITGAAGNLGSLLAAHLLQHSAADLRLMVHRHDVPEQLKVSGRSEVIRADLARPETLTPAVKGVEVIIHFAGILFKAGPEKFLPVTNTQYFQNLVDAANREQVRRVILISFPHVEGPTTPQHPATGWLDGNPVSWHARTRLEEEKYLFANAREPISLRVGMVYGRGMLMPDMARRLASLRLLGVWRQRTQIHLLSKEDFCVAVSAAAANRDAAGIYHLGDDGNDSLQEYLALACRQWRVAPPWKMPLWMLYSAAWCCELYSSLTGGGALLTKDFIDIGRVNYYGDTARMKQDLWPKLKYPTARDGLKTF
ncbi:MAG: NAD(P)-dependent oxidoreductase [Verrucomicrobiales bacterium]|jgi:nucleoside-diphosphate-sugar epimerase|nr:NAD(P)-dependent oxidoreductase [Verrucomicrobiales bacterium]